MTDTTEHDCGFIERHPVVWQAVFAAAILVALALSNAFSEITDSARAGEPVSTWQPFVWEFSSVMLTGALIPLVAWVTRRFPLATRRWYLTAPVHLIATLPYSIVHVSGMVALRKLAYTLAGDSYHFGPILSTWVYEYRKDFVTYWLIVAFVYAFDVYRRWREAQTTAEAADKVTLKSARQTPGALNRLVVRKFNREFILNTADIARIESSGNYVIVHTNGATYRLRSSLASLSKRLDERHFVQIHRSQVVNIDYIREIQPWDHGDYRVLLKDGTFINFSRRYRSRLAHLFNPPAEDHREGAARP